MVILWLAPAVLAVEPASGGAAHASYRRALERYAGGEPEKALDLLQAAESTLAAATAGDFDRIREVELEVVETLSGAAADRLLPVIALHESAYLAYRERGEMAAAFHSRTMMFLLAGLYGRDATSADEKKTAGDLFASLGGYFQATSSGSAGLDLFKQSLGFDSSNEAALLGAAVAYEQQGRYRQTLRYLERLTPTNSEGQLRLGINLGRTGSRQRAIAVLRDVQHGKAQQWVAVLAQQELGRLLIDEGRIDEARLELARGVERYPRDETLAIASIYLEERWGERRTEGLLEALEESARATGRPPRFRYSRDPVEPLERARERWLRRLEESLPALRRAPEPSSAGQDPPAEAALRQPPIGSSAIEAELRSDAEVRQAENPDGAPGLRVSLALSRPEPIRVVITHPTSETPVFGEVDIAAEVAAADPIVRVEFFLDRVLVATDREPPYRARIDAGDHNVAREFTVIAYDVSSMTGRATVVTHEVTIDDQVELSLRQLYVTVAHDKQAVLDLERSDFRVFDDGAEQQLVTFGRGDVPMTVVLLLDASDSMKGERLAAAMAAARELQAQLDALDEVMVVVFSDRTLSVTRFVAGNGEPAELVGVEAGGGTALNDHLYAALRLLDPRQGRPVVILLSDGADTLSFLRIEELFWKLQRSDAVVYRIRPQGSPEGQIAYANSWRGYQENVNEVQGLEQAVRESGGRVHSVPIDRLEQAVGAIVEELRQQYVLGYYPADRFHDGRWRPVRVEVGAPEARARTRSGYVDE